MAPMNSFQAATDQGNFENENHARKETLAAALKLVVGNETANGLCPGN